MSKNKEKAIAIELRMEGYTYGEIVDSFKEDGINVSKGSLSNWLKDVKLDDMGFRTLENSVALKKNRSLEKAREVKLGLRNAKNDKNTLVTGGFLCD